MFVGLHNVIIIIMEDLMMHICGTVCVPNYEKITQENETALLSSVKMLSGPA